MTFYNDDMLMILMTTTEAKYPINCLCNFGQRNDSYQMPQSKYHNNGTLTIRVAKQNSSTS